MHATGTVMNWFRERVEKVPLFQLDDEMKKARQTPLPLRSFVLPRHLLVLVLACSRLGFADRSNRFWGEGDLAWGSAQCV